MMPYPPTENDGFDNLTAKGAAQLGDESIFNKIKDAIRSAAEMGEFEVTVPHINERHLGRLREQGYDIEESENKLGKKYTIKFPLPE